LGALRGTFRLGFRGSLTPPLAWNASSSTVEAAVGALGTGPVSVARQIDVDDRPTGVGPAPLGNAGARGTVADAAASSGRRVVSDGLWDEWDRGVKFVVVFGSAALGGTTPLLTVDALGLRSTNFSALVAANVSTLVAGTTPSLDSDLKGQAVLVLDPVAAASGLKGAVVGVHVGYNAREDFLSVAGGGGGEATEVAAFDPSSGLFVKVIAGLVPGEPYNVRVTAFNGFGNAYGNAAYAAPPPKHGLEAYGVR
jgi:hypothetical protein